MRTIPGSARQALRRVALAAGTVLAASTLAACGGGVEVGVDVPSPPPPVAALGLQVTQTGPGQVQLDWGDDPEVHEYVVDRNGAELASVMATTVIDTTVAPGFQYCYQVSGYGLSGTLLAQTGSGCIVPSP
jgi:hypothetical protein